jgi:hypothetical protein
VLGNVDILESNNVVKTRRLLAGSHHPPATKPKLPPRGLGFGLLGRGLEFRPKPPYIPAHVSAC